MARAGAASAAAAEVGRAARGAHAPADGRLLSVMSFPAEGVESAIKNNIEDVRLFLDSKHPGHYAVYNLSSRTYRPAKFHNRVSARPPAARGPRLCRHRQCVRGPGGAASGAATAWVPHGHPHGHAHGHGHRRVGQKGRDP